MQLAVGSNSTFLTTTPLHYAFYGVGSLRDYARLRVN